MNETPVQKRSAALLAVGIILVALFAIQTGTFMWFGASLFRRADEISETLESMIDAQIDAGHDDPALSAEDPLLRDRRILLFNDVNSRTAKDVSARLLYLNSLDSRRPIDLYISTQGGWPDNAFAIIDTMRTIGAPVNAWAIGGCYSAGSLILAAATGRRYSTENTVLMIHANFEESQDSDRFPELDRERYERVFKEKTTVPEAWYPMTDDQSHYMTPKEALEFHLVDEIVPNRE